MATVEIYKTINYQVLKYAEENFDVLNVVLDSLEDTIRRDHPNAEMLEIDLFLKAKVEE